MSASSWNHYLSSHEDRDTYVKQADSIQALIDSRESPKNNFRLLSENKILNCLSRSCSSSILQLTFFHSTRRKTIMSSEMECYALMGYGDRAYAVKIEPDELFKQSTQKKRIPSFLEILACDSEQDLINLKPSSTMDTEKLESHVLLPPNIAELFFESEDMKALSVLSNLIALVKHIKSLTAIQQDDSSQVESDDSFELVNEEVDVTLISDQQETVQDQNEDINNDLERKYGNILKFVWSVIHHDNSIKPVVALPCTKPSTMLWLEKIHKDFLKPSNLAIIQQNMNPSLNQNTVNFQNVATSLCRLSSTLENHHEREIKVKEEKLKKKEKQEYEKLSEVQKNTLLLLTVKQGQVESDFDTLEITDTMGTLLEQGTSIKVQTQLQHEFSKRKHICVLSPSMCTSIKQGTLASQPTYRDINGLTPFCTPNENKEDRLDQATLLCLNEQIEQGTLDVEDVKKITKLRITFPQDFNAFRHYLRNFGLLLSLLTGPESAISKSVKELVSHAEDNELTYKDHNADEWTFFASVLDHVHRRTQAFIHSAGHGKIGSLSFKQLDFTSMLDSIENGTYQYFTPKWLKTKRKSNQSEFDFIQKKNLDKDKDSNFKKRKYSNRGEQVNNKNIHHDMKVPQDLKFGDLFHPRCREGVPTVNHDDGTVKCNNFWHRGFCFSKCRFKDSHNKSLNEDELEKSKNYVKALTEKWKINNGKTKIKEE